MRRSVVICSTVAFLLSVALVQVETVSRVKLMFNWCIKYYTFLTNMYIKQLNLSEFWDWISHPTAESFSAKNVDKFLSDQEKQLLKEQREQLPPKSEGNGLEDDLDYPEEVHISRWKRSPLDDHAVEGYEDEVEPQERFSRMIMNKTEGNTTLTIKELNPGYFELKHKFEHPELYPKGNTTDGNATAPAPPAGA